MRAFVTGGTGFIGTILVRKLRERGDSVVALVRDPAKAAYLRDIGAELVQGDLSDEAALQSWMKGADAVFHAAGIYRIGVPRSDWPAVEEANVHGTERVFDAAIGARVPRIIHLSSIIIFGDTGRRIVDEDYGRAPQVAFHSIYERTKYQAHLIAKDRIVNGAPVIIVQPCCVYGPGDHSELGAQIDQAMRGTLPVVTFARHGIIMCHVHDAADGILLAHDKGMVGRTYILGGEVTTLGQLVRAAAEASGRRPPRLALPTWAVKAQLPLAPWSRASWGCRRIWPRSFTTPMAPLTG